MYASLCVASERGLFYSIFFYIDKEVVWPKDPDSNSPSTLFKTYFSIPKT